MCSIYIYIYLTVQCCVQFPYLEVVSTNLSQTIKKNVFPVFVYILKVYLGFYQLSEILVQNTLQLLHMYIPPLSYRFMLYCQSV